MVLNVGHIQDERIPKTPPVIKPLGKGIARPLWSVMIPVYNCSAFLPTTLKSVLQQDPGEEQMEIEVVDDGSTDCDVDKLVKEVGRGRIKYFRQPENVGSLRNFLTCIDRSKGQLIHILHGDDVVRRDFYSKMENLFAVNPTIGAGFCRFAYINEKGRYLFDHEQEMEKGGILQNWLERIVERQRIQYVAMVVKRDVYEKLGGFYGVEYGEDWEMWVRIAAHYPVGYMPEVLAEYRRHSGSISGRSFLSGRNMQELQSVMDNIQQYLPEEKREVISMRSKKFYAHYALRVANGLWATLRHKKGVLAQIQAAWQMQKDIFLLYKILKLYTRIKLKL
jgi:glycosyltransferase involved in cell wall biosynthesis